MTDGSSSKPTPVRETLAGAGRREDVRFASVTFEADDGSTWWVEELGWTRTGRREDPGASLLLLGFRPGDAETFEREALVPAERLRDIPEHALPSLLASARSFRSPGDDKPFFSGARNRAREARGRGRGKRSRG